MDLDANFVCGNCAVSKKTYNDELLQLRTSFVEYKKRVICTDKLFKQLTAKRSQVTKVEGKLQEANNTLTQAQEQFKSTIINHQLTVEKCKNLELQLANVMAERDKELSDVLNIQQQKAALEEKFKSTNQRLQNVQAVLADKIKKLEAKSNGADKKALEKLNDKFVAQGVELTYLKHKLESQEVNCSLLMKELEDCKSSNDDSLKDKVREQEKQLSSLQDEMHEKCAEIKILKDALSKANEANKQVESLVDNLQRQEKECSLLRDLVTSQRQEMELLRQTAVKSTGDEKLKIKIKSQENEIILLREKLSSKQVDIKSTVVGEGDGNIGSIKNLQENLSEQDCQRTMLNTELQNLREQIETMKFEFEKNDTEKLKTQLAEKEREMSLLKNELEMQRCALEEAREKLEVSEKNVSQKNDRSPENDETKTLNKEEISMAEEMAALKLQLLKLQSEVTLKDEDMAKTIKEGKETSCDAEHLPESNVVVITSDDSRKSDEEIAALKLQLSSLETEVDLKSKEIEKLNIANKLLCKSDLRSESQDSPVSTAENSENYDAMKLQLSNLQTEVDLKAKEIKRLRENETKNVRSFEDFKEKERLAEERSFELVAELARLKAQDKGKTSVSQKCEQLERTLSLRDAQITQLRIELKGFLSCERQDSRKPSGARSASSGRGSCETSDLEDSTMLVDLDLDPDVGEILRSMAAVPALLAPIDSVKQPAPPVLITAPPLPILPLAPTQPYHQPTECSMQEKMLLALVESVRSATESYEKLYGTSIAVPVLPQPPPSACVSRAKPVGNAVVDEWIKNVSPEIGADQRSFSDGFGSASSSKGSVRETSIMQKPAMPDSQIRLHDRSREMSSAFSGRRAPGGAGITFVPSEVVALSRQLKCVSVKKSLYESDLERVRNSVALANKADLFVVSKAPTMASLCEKLDVEVPAKFADTTVKGKTAGSSANKRTTRSQVLKSTKEPSAETTITARKKPGKRKIPPISETFVRGTLKPKFNPLTELNCAKKNTCGTKNTARTVKTVNTAPEISAAVSRPEVTVPASKKKRKAKIDILFGSDDETPSPTKKQCADNISTAYSDDEISIVSVFSSDPVTPCSLRSKDKPLRHSLRKATEKQSGLLKTVAEISLVEDAHPKSHLVPQPLKPTDTNTVSLEVPSSNNFVVHVESEVSIPKAASPVPKFPAPESGNDSEVSAPKTEDDNNVQSKVMPPDPRIEGQALGSDELDTTVKESLCEIKMDDPQVQAEEKMLQRETTDNRNEDGSDGLLKDSTYIVDSRKEDVTQTVDAPVHSSAARSVDSEEIKLTPAQHLEDDDLSDCELVIADPVDEPLEISVDDDSPDDNDELPRLSESVQSETAVKDESAEYDSDDEPLSSLLSSPSKASSPQTVPKSPLKRTVATKKVEPPICILSPSPMIEISRPFFYKTQEEIKDLIPPPNIVEPSSPAPAQPPPPPPPPPANILRDETGVWNKRVYVTLAYNDAFNYNGELENKLSSKELAMVRFLRATLREYINTDISPKEVLAKTVEDLSETSGKCFAKEVIVEVVKDKGSVSKNKHDDLQTTKKVRKIVKLVVALHERNPTVTDETLMKIERKICNLSTKPPQNEVNRFISLHLGICLRLQLSERMRTFLYDVLYCFSGNSMIPVCSFILQTAPFALKHGFMGQDDITSLTVAYALRFGKNEWPHEDKALGELVAEQYKYKDKLLPTLDQLVEKIVRLLKDDNLDFVEACLVLIAKRVGWMCASQKIIPAVLSVVDVWRYRSMPVRCATVALHIVAYIVRTIPSSDGEVADTLFNRISSLLQSGKPEIYEPVLKVLMMMGKEKHYTTIVNLLNSHEETTSDDFIACATAYVAKVTCGKRARKPPVRFSSSRVVQQIEKTNCDNEEDGQSDDEDTKEKLREKVKLEKKFAKNRAKRQKWIVQQLKD